MTTRSKIISGYFGIALVFAVYLANWGDSAYRGFAYNLGAAIFWPITMFPGLGKIIGGIIMIIVVVLVLMLSSGNRE